MEVGAEYLVFAEAVSEDMRTGDPLVKLRDDFVIAPVFSYDDHQNVVIPVPESPTDVPYKDVRDNEFFGTTEKTLQLMEDLKSQMLSLYPRDVMN